MRAGLQIGNRRYSLPDGPCSIGRDELCTIVLTDGTISRRHALILPVEDDHVLVDLASSNGVTVNGSRIETHTLRETDDILLGSVECTYAPSTERPRAKSKAAPDDATAPEAGHIFEKLATDSIDTLVAPGPPRDDTTRLMLLYYVSKMVGSILPLDQLLDRIIHLGLSVFHADRSLLLMVDPDGSLKVAASKTRGKEKIAGELLHFSTTIASYCAEERKPILTEDATSDPRFERSGSVQMLNIRCALAAPLQHGEHFFGVLYLDNRMSSLSFSDADLKMIQAFASQVALAIENSRLYQTLMENMQKLHRQQEALLHQEKLATIGQLAAGVAHEMRGPLTVISSYAQMLERKDNDPETTHKCVANVLEGCSRLSSIVSGLLDFSRKSRGQKTKISVNALVRDTLSIAEHTLSCIRNVKIERDFAESLADIVADRHLLQQVFLNLIVNAGQAMPEGGSLTISTHPVNGTVAIRVEDTGVGISPEKLAEIFKPFYTEGKTEGTGLGLAISKAIIEQHGGDIAVHSEPGRGTCFTVTLPVGQDHTAPPA